MGVVRDTASARLFDLRSTTTAYADIIGMAVAAQFPDSTICMHLVFQSIKVLISTRI
jgi:hypothetical protein